MKSKFTLTSSANRQIKDGVFKLLFEKPENAAELYYAITDTEIDLFYFITCYVMLSSDEEVHTYMKEEKRV